MSSSSKSDYQKGYEQGQKDSGRIKDVVEIVHDAIWPGRLPCEKSEDYKEGYDRGKEDSKKNR